jgi:hypothetical protein
VANKYCWSGATGTGDGSSWANAYTTLTLAAAGMAAGDDLWVAHDHAETTAGAVTINIPSTDGTTSRVIAVSRAGSVPPVAADMVATPTASVTTTGANNLNISASSYVYGITFNCGTGSSAATLTCNLSAKKGVFENCAFKNLTTSTTSSIIPSGTGAWTDWINCTVEFGNALQGFGTRTGKFRWSNKPTSAAIVGATLPTTLVVSQAAIIADWEWSGLDLSALGAGKTLVNPSIQGPGWLRIVNCKLGASVTVSSTPAVRTTRGPDLIGCGSTGNVERNERYRQQGTLTTETTIVRTGGASDGTTPYSWKIVTTANSKREDPFESFEGAIWNDQTGSAKTLTVHVLTDNVTLQDGDCWLEVEYLGSSATPVTTMANDAPATVLTAAANQPTDSGATWTTTGLTTPVKQTLDVTFTPQMAGPIRWRVKVAKPSITVYVDPNPGLV